MIHLLLCAIWLLVGASWALAASKYEDSVKELAEGVAAEAIKLKKARLAVLDFTDQKGDATPIGKFLAEELATHLLVAGELKIVDHKLLVATMAHHDLTHLEPAQAKAAKKVAKALRADLFVTGTYLEIPEGVQVTARLVGPYTVSPVGAARTLMPKSGPLTALLKQANAPKPPVVVAPAVPTPPPLKAHENEWYTVNVIGFTRQGDHLVLDLLYINRSPHPVKIGCQLQDTYLQDEQGATVTQEIAENREGLCTRAMELHARSQQRARLSFTAKDSAAAGPWTLHYHETSPRTDRLVLLDGLTFHAAPSNPEPSTPPPAPAP